MKDVVKTEKPRETPTRPRRRRRNLSLYYLMIITVCVLIFLILSRTILFNISEYDVEGNSIYTAETILSAGNLREGRNMYGINLKKTEKNIKDKLVYIEDIKLRRKLPDKLLVSVTEARAFACCEYEGSRYAIITKTGRYLETEQLGPRAGLILIKGMELTDVSLGADFSSQDDAKKDIILDLMGAISEICDGKITEIDITDRTNITMKYQDRIDIDFGSSLDYEYKLRYITAIIEENLEPDAEGTIIYHSSAAGASFIKKEDMELTEAERDALANAQDSETGANEAEPEENEASESDDAEN